MAEQDKKVAAFLIRCSTNKQDYQRQIKDLNTVAERFGFVVKPEFIFGQHITGKDDTTKTDRISIIECRKAAEAHRYDVLLVNEVSRMSRDSVSGRVYVRQFRNLGIPIYFRDKNKWTMDLNTLEVDELFERDLGSYFDGASDYLKSMKTQIASGRRSHLSNNQLVIGHPPIGYKRRGGRDKWTKNELIIDEEVAPMVKDVFAMYVEDGATLKSVALAISSKYNKRKSVSGIQQILAREEYWTGKYIVYLSDPDYKNQPPEPFEITFEPLIDKETYEAASRKRVKQNVSREPYPKQKVHLLTKLIKCPYCGHSFSPRQRSGDNGNKYRIVNGKIAYSWLCMSRINNSGDCISHVNLNGEKTETIIWDFVKKELIDHADLHKDTRAEKIYDLERRINEAQNQIPLYQQEIDRTELLVNRAYNAYINAPESAIDMAQKNYNETLSKVVKTREDYEKEINRLKEHIISLKNSVAYYKQSNITPEYIKSIEDNDMERRKILLQVVEKIVPYGITPGIVSMEVHTIEGLYYILNNGHNVGKKRIAYYIPAPFAVWHPMKEGELQQNEKDSYFTIKNADIIQGTEDVDVNHVTFDEMLGICEANGWTIPYNYIYNKD